MSQCHHHHHCQSQENIKTAFFLNLGFTIVEIIGGLMTNSMAILADALHDLGDSFALGLSWYFAKLSNKKPTAEFTYGFKRFSLLAALLNGILLLAGSLIIFSQAIPRLFNPEPAHAAGMFFFALLGILVNGLAALKLQRGKTMNERMVSWHMVEDVLGWAAVLVASVVMMFKDIPILDPILSILIMLYILWNVVKNLKATFLLFLQGVPKAFEIAEIEGKIKSLANVIGVHNTHVWSLDGENNILTAHIVVTPGLSNEEIFQVKCRVKEELAKNHIQNATLEIEQEGEHCN